MSGQRRPCRKLGTAELTSGDIQALALSQGLKSGGLRRVAAIDIGTNSTHLLVASVDPALGTFSIIQAEKSTDPFGGARSRYG